jgi:hypothetical protein
LIKIKPGSTFSSGRAPQADGAILRTRPAPRP